MTATTSLPIRDAITGEPVTVTSHNRWVLLNAGDGEDAWLTPMAAQQLAARLLNAADEVADQ